MFKDFFSSSRALKADLDGTEPTVRQATLDSGAETVPIKMNLEERMAFRREILFDGIRGTLGVHGIAPHTYRCKVMRTDKRGHCFVVMLDMCESFMASPAGQHARLAAIAADLAVQSEAENHLLIVGVYWRLDATLAGDVADPFKRSQSAALDSESQGRSLTSMEQDMLDSEVQSQRSGGDDARQRAYTTSTMPL